MRPHPFRRGGLACAGLALSLAACSLQIDEKDYATAIDADVSDTPAAGLALTPALVTVTEGQTAELTVSATRQLDNDITVTLGADATLGLSVNTVVLSPSQPMATFTITALDDDDAQPGSATVNAQATGLGVATAQVQVMEDDVLELEASQASVTVNEDASTTVMVRLKASPTGDLTVAVASGDTNIAAVAPPQLIFSGSNWSDFQSVTIAGNHDVDAEDDTTGITFTNALLPTLTVQATVVDIDRLAILASPGSITVTEQGTAQTISVHLSQQPSSDVTITAAPGSAGIQVSPSTRTFTPQNYAADQTFSVTALADDDTAGFTTTLTLTASGGNITPLPVTVVVNDDDTQVILSNAPDPLVVGESASVTFGARLAYRPTGNVVVGVSALDTGVATASPGALMFTTTTWDQNQTVTVTGVHDDNVALDSTTVRLQAPGLTTNVATNVTDIDVQDLMLAGQPSTVPEGGVAGFTVRLAYRPAATTTVTISSNNPAIVVNTPSLTFNATGTSYSTPQMVSLSAPVDGNVIEESAVITVASSGLPSKTFTATVAESTVIAILTSTGSVAVTEQAAGVPFNVTLSNPPSGTMTVNITSNNPGVTVNPTSLQFDAGNYNGPRAVTVSALMDDDVAGYTAMLTLAATGATSASVTVMVTDDDVQAIQENAPTTIDVIDPDGTAPVGVTFGVRLAYRPAANTTVNVASLNTGVATVSPGSLSFTTSNWDQEKTVTVTAVADVNMTNGATTVRLTSTGLPMVDIPVAVTDQDVQVVEVNPVAIAMSEGATTTLQVRLKYQPAASTTVTLSSSNPEVTVPATVGFTTGTYGMYQGATVTSVADSDQVNDTATITLGNFDAPIATTVPVTVTDTTVVANYGWPTGFGASQSVFLGEVIAYQMQQVFFTEMLFKVGLHAAAAGGDYRIAIYGDAGNIPGTLLYASNRTTIGAMGVNELSVTPQSLSPATSYWIAIRTSPQASLGHGGTTTTGRRCVRNVDINNLDTAWPTTFGASTCSTTGVLNLYMATFRQP